MQAFLEYVVKGLVDHPDQATVTPVAKDALTIYELRLHPDDVGKVIGRQGITINAIRSLLLAGSAKKGLRCTLEIVEDKPRPRETDARRRRGASMKIDVLTLFPEMFSGPMDASIIQRARQTGLLDLRVHNLRDYTHDNYKTVDDRPFGGGPGMVLEMRAGF